MFLRKIIEDFKRNYDMPRSFLRLSVLSMPLFLAACGDGFEAQKTQSFTPYGNSRTAGSGVVYVRAQLLPQKELKLEPELKVSEPAEAVVTPMPEEKTEPTLNAEKIFKDAQTKGSTAKQASVNGEKTYAKADAVQEVKTAEVESVDDVQTQTTDVVESYVDDRERAVLGSPVGDIDGGLVSEEQGTLEEAKNVDKVQLPAHAQEKEGMGFESGLMQSELSPEAGDMLDEIVEVEEDFAERALRQPIKEIVVPKRDRASILSVGQETLNEIYSSPF